MDEFTGMNIVKHLQGDYQKECYRIACRQLYLNYGPNVDYERLAEQILLCDETRDFLYAPPQPTKYKSGTRIELENIVEQITEDCKSRREIVLAIMCFIRDLYKKYNRKILFYGGTEEELIKKGDWLCECVSRLMVALCEIKGIPGRTVFHVFSGHFTSELYFEDRWGYVDPRFGLFYLDEKGYFASVDRLVRNPQILLNQDDYVKSFCVEYADYHYRLRRNLNFCLNPKECQCFCNYSLMDKEKYRYDWVPYDTAQEAIKEVHERYMELSTLIFL